MNEIKATIVSPSSLSEWGSRGLVTDEASSYSNAPLLYRALQLRCDTLVSVPRYVYSLESDEETDWEFEDSLSLRDLLWLVEASYLLRGAAWLLKLQNVNGYGKGVQWLNPFSMHWDEVGGVIRFWQIDDDGRRYPEGGYWSLDDFVYFKAFDPLCDDEPGTSATSVALKATQTSANINNFLAKFFESDALPVTMLMLPQGTSPEERERVEGWFRKKLSNVRRNVQRVLGVSADVKIEKLTAELSTFDFPSVDEHVIKEIAWAYGIPKTLLTADSANRATAEVEYSTFLTTTIIPRCEYFESILNPFLAEYGQRIEFAPQELPALQEDEAQRTTSLKALVDAGVPLMAALDILGYDLSDEAQKLIEKSVTDKEAHANQIPVNPPPNQPVQPQQDAPQADPMKVELDRWKTKAIKSVKAGGGGCVSFDSLIIPQGMQDSITAGLINASTVDDVKAIFAKV